MLAELKSDLNRELDLQKVSATMSLVTDSKKVIALAQIRTLLDKTD